MNRGTGKDNGELPLGIVTVTYSPGRHLPALVESLPDNVVLILADNGSVDGVPEEVAASDDRVILVPTGGNIGYGGAANRGIAELARMGERGEVRDDYVLLVNPDVTFDPGAIEALLDCAGRTPRAGSVGPRIEEPDGSTYPSARAVPELVSGTGHALLADIWPKNPFSRRYRDDSDMDRERDAGWLSGSCLLLDRQAFDSVGGFDSRYFMYMEDVDLGDRLGRAGWRNVYCPTSVIRHDQGHSAKQYRKRTLMAHHESAYRFMSDRLPGPGRAPVRWALKAGLWLRVRLILAIGTLRSTR